MVYNITNITNSENIYEGYRALNTLSNGYMTVFLLAAIFFIVMMVFKSRYGFTDLLLGDSFMCSILSISFMLLGLVGWPVVIIFLILFFVMLVIKLFMGG